MRKGRGDRPRSARGVYALAWGMTMACCVAPVPGGGGDSLRIEKGLSAGPYYVGQEVVLTLRVEVRGERPSVAPFRVAGADVSAIPAGPEPVKSGAGDGGSDVHPFAFRIIPRRTGTLDIPPVSVRQDSRSGMTRPARFVVCPLPSGGRPRGFLGGVGAFRLEAEASPRSVRAGGDFEYRLRIIGPAARGSRDAPDLTPFRRVPLGLRLTRLSDEVSIEPPSRAYRYRIRATRPGSAVLPPVTVASFDPKTAHYLTKASPGVPVQVADPPRLDPRTVDEAPLLDSTDRGRPTLDRIVAGILGVIVTAAALVWLVSLVRRRRDRGRGRRFASRVARRLDASEGAAETARRVTEGIVAYLNLTAGRPPGALTPDEAGLAFEGLTGRHDLAEDARRLVALCDRALYSEDGAAVEELVTRAKRLFGGLEREEGRAGGGRQDDGGEKPTDRREAAGTADDVGRSRTASP